MDAIRLERKDSIDWSRLNLTNFSVHSFKAVAHYDPSSHWGLELGIVSHKRTAVDNHSFNLLGRKDSYNSVAPIVELTYRPMGYNGPILTIDYERGIRKFMGSDTDYERVEIDGQYKHAICSCAPAPDSTPTRDSAATSSTTLISAKTTFPEAGTTTGHAHSSCSTASGTTPQSTTCVPMPPTRHRCYCCRGFP